MVVARVEGVTAKLLPERYAYVRSQEDAGKALDILDLAVVETTQLSSTPLEIKKAEIREMVLAQTRALFPSVAPQAFKVVKLDERKLPLAGIRNESGFRIVNTDAIQRCKGMNGELITVIYARTSENSDAIVPLVFAHADSDGRGSELRQSIYNYCRQLYGKFPDEMVHSRTHRLLEKFLNQISEHRKQVVVGAMIVSFLYGSVRGIGSLMDSAHREQGIRQVEYQQQSPARIQFVKAQLASMDGTQSQEVQVKLLESIKREHYDSLAAAMEGEQAQRMGTAETIGKLVHYEVTLKRADSYLGYASGPKEGVRNQVTIQDKGDKAKFLTDYLNSVLAKEYSAELRAPLVKALEEVSRSMEPPSLQFRH